MKATINQLMADLNFNYLIHNLGIEPAPKEIPQEEKYNEWMKKMGNIHYNNNEAMIRGYEIVKANNNI